MEKYTFIFNNSADCEHIDNNNPFIKGKFDSNEQFLTFCKNYYTYINVPPIFTSSYKFIVYLDTLKISFNKDQYSINDFISLFNERLDLCKKKTPFFIMRHCGDFNVDFSKLNNTLLINENIEPVEYINEYFKKRPAEENIIYHVIALCYNESRLLPHFLNHYKTADKIIIYDNESTDNSVEIMMKYNVSEIKTFDSFGFNDFVHSTIKNNCWQESKGIADFVIVQDMDEFVHFPESPYSIRKGLLELKKKNTAHVLCKGYDMSCTDEEFEHTPIDKPIFDYIKRGYYNESYSKPNIINPNVLDETDWEVGNHNIRPKPNIEPTVHNVLILHYKHLGINWAHQRRIELRNQIILCKSAFGEEYRLNDEKTLEYVKDVYHKSKNLGHIIKNKLITGSVIEYYKVKGLSGRLGNQLFNIFTTLALSFEYGFEPFFICSGKIEQDYRDKLFRNLNIVDDYDIEDFVKVIESNQNTSIDFTKIAKENKVLIQGYFQCSKYFHKHKDRILNIIKPSLEEQKYIDEYVLNLQNKFTPKKLVGIHIRRGDYISLNWNLTKDYYKKAIDCYEPEEHSFIIFSDDKEWCKIEYPTFEVCEINQSYEDYIEMYIMSKMNSIIISNSTFSWWSAYIGNPETVICPYPWFKNTSFNPDIYEKDWIQVIQ